MIPAGLNQPGDGRVKISGRILGCLPLLAAVVALPAPADVSLRIMDKQGAESILQVSAGRCRFETTDMPGYAVIDTRNHTVTRVDTARREYSTLTEEQLRASLDKVDQVRDALAPHMETLRNGLQALSPEQRAMAEQFIGAQAAPAAGPPVTLVADRGTQRIAGLSCTHHRLMQGRRQVGDACLLQRAGGPVSREDFATLDAAMSLLRELSGRAGGLLAQAGSKSALLDPGARGIPIALRDYGTGESYRVVAASPRRLDEQLFSSHRGYRQVDAPAVPGLF